MRYDLRTDLIEQMREEVYLNMTLGIVFPCKQLGTFQLQTPDDTITFANYTELQEYYAEQLPYMKEFVAQEYGEDIAEIVC